MAVYKLENLLVKQLYSDHECVTVTKEDQSGSITVTVAGEEDRWLAYFGMLVTQPIPNVADVVTQPLVTWRDGIYMQALKVYIENTPLEMEEVEYRFTAQLY